MGRSATQPINMPKLHERFLARVRDVTSEGNGVIEHPCGKTFFVAGVWPGETGEFRITGFKSRYGFAELVSLQSPSSARVSAPCPHHGFTQGQCGGCPWQFIDYPEQLKVKQQRVEWLLKTIDEDLQQIIKPIWGSEKVFGYRNRAQFKTDGVNIGYVSSRSSALAPIQDCLILNDKNRTTLQDIISTLPRKDFKPRSKKNRGRSPKKSSWNTLDIDDQCTAESLSINQRRPFRQGNTGQNKAMRNWLYEKLVALEPQKTKACQVVELFSGSGNFTEIISSAGFENILAVEGAEDPLKELKSKNLPGVETLINNLFLPEKVAEIFQIKQATEILVLDPPRDGFKGIEGLFSSSKKIASCLTDIFYVSCNPATFVRDIKYFYQQGFRLREVQPLDQFPHTPHVELLGVLTKE